MKATISKADGSVVTIKGSRGDVAEVLRALGYENQPQRWPWAFTPTPHEFRYYTPSLTCGTSESTATVTIHETANDA